MFWLTAFLDVPPPHFEPAVDFWSAVSGWTPSARRGDDEEFLTLTPAEGDPHLKMQRVGDGAPRLHLDVHVPDPRAEADRAIGLGAVEVADQRADQGYVVLRSPGGLTFCLVNHPAGTAAPAASWPGGSRSAIDQVCLDIPRETFEDEAGFWQSLLGWPRSGASLPEFDRLVRPDDQALRILMQRTGDDGPVRAHLDLACSQRDREILRHVGLGAHVVSEHSFWTVLEDPAGMHYCLTDRPPA
ncbi:VOC family protein [Nocardioides currus]|uniref:VOC domain-containing protein n=1 Tax=Nocardioides currus TaxID=2133958 RepID=A0A2R7Z172_9ACTN|nr:VOC family protein [Nocardioides currus]PUA82314.1 hypothetical protein C7S10_00710 [Nocardioides currus]